LLPRLLADLGLDGPTPTLVIHGAGDEFALLDLCGRKTAQAIPGSRLAVYDTGHGLFITEQEGLNRDLLAFIRG
jgi:non-heme chloroperoxidase